MLETEVFSTRIWKESGHRVSRRCRCLPRSSLNWAQESPRTSNTDADSIPELMGKDLGRRLLLAIPVPPLKGAPQACPEQDGRPSDQ